MAGPLKLATWNVNSLRIRTEDMRGWLERNRPHAVCLQETKVVDDEFPLALFDNLGYEVACHGQKQYNGVAIASRSGLGDVRIGIPGFADEQARVIAATVAGVRLLSVYVPNGGGGEAKMAYKMDFLAHLRGYLADLRGEHEIVAAGGDYNVAPEDVDVYDIDDYGRDGICVSAHERAAYADVLEAGYADVHRQLGGKAHSHTWWDYRGGSFDNDRGLRIDHFLVSGGSCASIAVDLDPRRSPRPSDHAPVILEMGDGAADGG